MAGNAGALHTRGSLILSLFRSVVYQNKDVKMLMLLRIHVVFFAVCFSVNRVEGISNIFKDLGLFDLSLSSNDSSSGVVNVTIHQGT